MATFSNTASLLVAAGAGAGLAVAYMHRNQAPQEVPTKEVQDNGEDSGRASPNSISVLLVTCGEEETDGLVAALGARKLSQLKNSNLHLFGKGKQQRAWVVERIHLNERGIVRVTPLSCVHLCILCSLKANYIPRIPGSEYLYVTM